MPTRREFLKRISGTTAGIFFVGCNCANSSLAYALGSPQSAPQTGTSRKRPDLYLGGKRVMVIDIHSHVRVPEAWDLVKDRMGREGRTVEMAQANPEGPYNINSIVDRLANLDEMGIDLQAVSINPFWYWADVDLARKVIQIQNEKIAALCAAHPNRFVGLGSVALQHPSLAVEQIEEGVRKLGMRGFAIGGSVAGDELSNPRFNPIWAKAEELQTLIFIHPQTSASPVDEKRMQGNGLLDNVIGHPLETTLALTHLIQDGTLDLFPRLKICAAHGGGYLPSYSSRNDQCLKTFPKNCKPLKKLPSEYLKQLYYDSVLFTPEDMRHLIAVVGSSQVVVGTDYPAPWNRTPVDGILTIPGLNDEERIAIFAGTAAKLLKISV